MYKLYTKRLVGKDAFKEHTGIKVKAMPKPHKSANKPNMISVSKDWKGTPPKGYRMRGSFNKDTHEWSFFMVKEEYLKTLEDNDVSSYDNNHLIKNEVDLHLELNVAGYKDADAPTRYKLLEGYRDDFVDKFGENIFEMFSEHLTNLSGVGQYYSAKDKATIDAAFNNILYIASIGEDTTEAVGAYIAAFDNAWKNLSAEHIGDIPNDIAEELLSAATQEYKYSDGDKEDEEKQALGLMPKSFNAESISTEIRAYIEEKLNGMTDAGVRQKLHNITTSLHMMDEQQLVSVWLYIASADLFQNGIDQNPFEEGESRYVFFNNGKEIYDSVQTLAEEKQKSHETRRDEAFVGNKIARENGVELPWYEATQVGALYNLLGIADTEARRNGVSDTEVDNEELDYLWNLIDWVKDVAVSSEMVLSKENYGSRYNIIEKANEAISNILLKRVRDEEVNEEDYTILKEYGMTDIIEYIKDMETVQYSNLPASTKNQILQKYISDRENDIEAAENKAAQIAKDEAAKASTDFASKVDSVRNGENTINWLDGLVLINSLANFALPNDPEQIVTLLKGLEGLRTTDDPKLRDYFEAMSDNLSVITQTQIDSLYYYFGKGQETGDFTDFNEYWDLVKNDYAEAVFQAGKSLTSEYVDEKGPWGELYAAAVSINNSPKAFGAYLETAWDAITGQEVDTSSPAQLAARAANDYAYIATEDMEGVGKIAADIAIGLVKNAPAIVLSIVGTPLAGMAYSAAMTAGTDAAQQNAMGVSAGQALLHSTIMAGIDFLMSALPLGSLSVMAKGGMAGVISGAKVLNNTLGKVLTYGANFVIQAGIGFTEGMLTSLVSNLADIWVAGENSQYAQLVRQYMQEQGISEQAASAVAMQTLWQNALQQSVVSGAMGGASSIIATAVGFKRLNEQVQDGISTLIESDGVSAEKKAILTEMSEDLKENPIQIVDEASERLKMRIDSDPKGVQKAMIDGYSTLIEAEKRIKRESGNINHQGMDISRAYDAYTKHFFDGEDLQASAEAMTVGIQEAIASGMLTEAEVRGLDGVLAELVGDVDSAKDVRDNGNGKNEILNYAKLSKDLGKNLDADGYKVIDVENADQANSDWADMGFDKPPIATGTKVYNIEAGNKSYSRVYCEGYNYPKSRFLLRAEDVEGMSAQEIYEKYALPRVPNKIVHISIPADTPMEVSIVGPQEFNGIKTFGGDIQYAIKDVILKDEWFRNIEDLK